LEENGRVDFILNQMVYMPLETEIVNANSKTVCVSANSEKAILKILWFICSENRSVEMAVCGQWIVPYG